MSEFTLIAVPSSGEGGLDGEWSGHFGHCDCYTLVAVVDGKVGDVRILANPPHVEGGCLRPVELLASNGVDAIVAIGMGARPLAGFQTAGIGVYFEDASPRIGDAVQRMLDGDVVVFDGTHSCGGGCH